MCRSICTGNAPRFATGANRVVCGGGVPRSGIGCDTRKRGRDWRARSRVIPDYHDRIALISAVNSSTVDGRSCWSYGNTLGLKMVWDEYFDSAATGRRPTSDFEWYAVDRKGQIAFLTSSGFGAIPLVVFRHKAEYYKAAEAFKSLPIRCDHVLVARRSLDYSSWVKVACQGLFGFDWSPNAGQYVPRQPYELIAAPATPLTLTDLPVQAREWVLPIRFNVDFGVVKELIVEQEFKEVNL